MFTVIVQRKHRPSNTRHDGCITPQHCSAEKGGRHGHNQTIPEREGDQKTHATYTSENFTQPNSFFTKRTILEVGTCTSRVERR